MPRFIYADSPGGLGPQELARDSATSGRFFNTVQSNLAMRRQMEEEMQSRAAMEEAQNRSQMSFNQVPMQLAAQLRAARMPSYEDLSRERYRAATLALQREKFNTDVSLSDQDLREEERQMSAALTNAAKTLGSQEQADALEVRLRSLMDPSALKRTTDELAGGQWDRRLGLRANPVTGTPFTSVQNDAKQQLLSQIKQISNKLGIDLSEEEKLGYDEVKKALPLKLDEMNKRRARMQVPPALMQWLQRGNQGWESNYPFRYEQPSILRPQSSPVVSGLPVQAGPTQPTLPPKETIKVYRDKATGNFEVGSPPPQSSAAPQINPAAKLVIPQAQPARSLSFTDLVGPSTPFSYLKKSANLPWSWFKKQPLYDELTDWSVRQ